MKKLWHLIERIFGIYRWHPKIALRYLPVVKELKKREIEADVLEIGSGGLGIAPYLKQRVVGADTEFKPPIFEKLIPVIARAQNLPFADQSFQAVISLDMLEHIRPEDRPEVIAEAVRVAKDFVCIGAPMGHAAHKQDELLREEFKKRNGTDFTYLKEQVEYGLPEEAEVISQIKQAAEVENRKISIRVLGNINLKFRHFMMRGWMTKSPLIDFIFRKVLILPIPLFLKLNQKPAYRKIIFVDFK